MHPCLGRLVRPLVLAALVAGAGDASAAFAQRLDVHEDGSAHYHGLHFSHPLFAESITPDTKVRLNTEGEWEAEGNATAVEVEAEYAFQRSVSVELMVPYARLDLDGAASTTSLGNIEVAVKFANFAFEDAGVLLGYGVAVGLPTGNSAKGIGSSSEWEVEPYLNAGLKRGILELTGWAIFGLPLNVPADEDIANDFTYNVVGLVHAKPWLQALLELNGQVLLNGPASGSGAVFLSPGIKVAPVGPRLFIGVGVGIPLNDTDVNSRALLSLFYHL